MRRPIPRSLLAVAAALTFAGWASAGEAPDAPMIVKIHADWCGTCQRLEPTFRELDARLGDDARIVVLDVTDRDAVERSRAEADRLGIRAFFDTHKGKTGTVGVLSASGEPVRVMKGELDVSKYVEAVAQAAADAPEA